MMCSSHVYPQAMTHSDSPFPPESVSLFFHGFPSFFLEIFQQTQIKKKNKFFSQENCILAVY